MFFIFQLPQIQQRFSSNTSSEKFEKIENHPEVQVEKNPPEWKFVQDLLPPSTIPKPILKEDYPSGWTPPRQEATEHPYFIERNKNFMIPVYLHKKFRGQRQITQLRKVEGDIWKLEDDLRQKIEKVIQKPVASRINEMSRVIQFHGDHVEIVRDFLIKKGF